MGWYRAAKHLGRRCSSLGPPKRFGLVPRSARLKSLVPGSQTFGARKTIRKGKVMRADSYSHGWEGVKTYSHRVRKVPTCRLPAWPTTCLAYPGLLACSDALSDLIDPCSRLPRHLRRVQEVQEAGSIASYRQRRKKKEVYGHS